MAVSGNGAAVDGTDNPAGISRRHHIFRNVFIRTLPIQLTALSPIVTLVSLKSLQPDGPPLQQLKKMRNDLPVVQNILGVFSQFHVK